MERTLPYCQKRWEPNLQQYVDNNSLEVIDCCLKSCQPYANFCFGQCQTLDSEKIRNCQNTCNELWNDCKNVCKEYPSESVDIIRHCAEENQCGHYPRLDYQCMQLEKDSIIACCTPKCPECDCGKAFSYVTAGNKPILLNYSGSKKGNYIYIILLIFTALVIFGLLHKFK